MSRAFVGCIALIVAVLLAAVVLPGLHGHDIAGTAEKAATAAVCGPAPTAQSPATGEDQPSPTPGASPSLKPLTGENLCGPTRLRLLITSGNVPVVLDIDSGDRHPVAGMSTDPGRQTWIQPAPGNAAVIMSSCDNCGPNASVFSLALGTTGARFLGMASDVAPDGDGHSVWLQADNGSLGCLLTQVGSDGRIVTASRRTNCRFLPRQGTPLGLLTTVLTKPGGTQQEDAILNPTTGTLGLHRSRIYAVAGQRMLTDGTETEPTDAFAITDASGHTLTTLPRPSTVGEPGNGQVSADGRYIAVTFGNPACPGPRQCMDLWVLDLTAGRWLHVPSMPTAVDLKRSDVGWTSDGRLVLLGDFDGIGDTLAIWRPGDAQLQLRAISLPADRGQSFAAWSTA